MRYDACVIGGDADGLAAAATLAARGLKVVVVERDSRCGGRCATREFHPGFSASPFADELPEITSEIFRSLDLARRGAVLMPTRHAQPPAWTARVDALRRAIIGRVMADTKEPPSRGWFKARIPLRPWPGEELAGRSLCDLLGEVFTGNTVLLAGPLCDPALPGSALQLLAGPGGGMAAGGLGRLGDALRAAAEEAGAEISCGLEVADIRCKGGRAVGVGLADGSELMARTVISTLDLKRTFLSLFAWNALPRDVVDRAGAFRPAPATARLLLALDAPPDLPAGMDPSALRGPLAVASDEASLQAAYRVWCSAMVPERPPAVVRLVSAVDPLLVPEGAACMTVTLGAIPHTPFDGVWTHEKRDKLRQTALTAVEEVFPGSSARVLGAELIVPPDMENMLGMTGGDLSGGELAADQMLDFRPFAACRGTRTPVDGLYLAGPSSTLGPLATCASGIAAAHAVMADFAAGRLR